MAKSKSGRRAGGSGGGGKTTQATPKNPYQLGTQAHRGWEMLQKDEEYQAELERRRDASVGSLATGFGAGGGGDAGRPGNSPDAPWNQPESYPEELEPEADVGEGDMVAPDVVDQGGD